MLRKIVKTNSLILLLLVLAIFANSAMDEVCFCGSACADSLSNHAEPEAKRHPFHHHCAETHCKSCNFEDGQTLKAKNARTNQAESDLAFPFAPLFTFRTDSSYAPLYNPISFVDPEPINIARLTPIYLKNQSLLC